MSYDEDTFPFFDKDTYDDISQGIEEFFETQADRDAAAGQSYVGDEDLNTLEALGYETEELERGAIVGSPFQLAEFGLSLAVDSENLIPLWAMKELKIKHDHGGVELWDEGETLEGQSAQVAMLQWLDRNGYVEVDRLSGAWPGGSEQEISVDHTIDAVSAELKVPEEWVDAVGEDVHGQWWKRGSMPWSSSDGDITMYAVPKREHSVLMTVELDPYNEKSAIPMRGFMGDLSGTIGGDQGDLRNVELEYDPEDKELSIDATLYSKETLDEDEIKRMAEEVFSEAAGSLYPEIWKDADYGITQVANPGKPPTQPVQPVQSTKKLKAKLLR